MTNLLWLVLGWGRLQDWMWPRKAIETNRLGKLLHEAMVDPNVTAIIVKSDSWEEYENNEDAASLEEFLRTAKGE
jgi:hypothetical protein